MHANYSKSTMPMSKFMPGAKYKKVASYGKGKTRSDGPSGGRKAKKSHNPGMSY